VVLDTSAVLAILLQEPGAETLETAIEADDTRLMSAVSVLEAAIVIQARKGMAGARELDLLLRRAQVQIEPLTAEHVEIARDAWTRFGRGNHPARLNLGDCCAYALAESSGDALLFKGADFAKTDVAAAPGSLAS